MLSKEQPIYYNWLRFLIIILLVLGVFFRFANLDKKLYWNDEVATSIRISGYSFKEIQQSALQGNEMTVEEWRKYQYPNPEKGLVDLVKGLATEEPQLPPLYFVLARFWVQLFGNSVAVTRSFSAAVSLLAFPCIYWLCKELFASPLTGWVAMALIAISPLHLLYAQEARPFSLWIVTILLSSAALLRAMRLQTKLSWGVYAATLVLGFYTYLLSGLVAIGHGIYAIVNERFRFTNQVKAYLLASLTGTIIFIPWIIAILSGFSEATETTEWSKEKVHLPALMRTWILNLSRSFFDINESFLTRNLLIYIFIIVLVGYAVYFLCRQTPKQVWLFVLTLIGVTAVALALPDVISGGKRSAVIRYLIPSYLGIQIAIAYLLATKISALSMKNWQKKLWQIAMVFLISMGVVSCAVSSQSETWWNRYRQTYLPEATKVINQTERPLVLGNWYNLLGLRYAVKPQVRLVSFYLQLVEKKKSNPLKEVRDVFIYLPPDGLKEFLEKKYNYRLVKTYSWKGETDPVKKVQTTLWQLSKKGKANSDK
ncbi:glycosyltransferase family 39 protein [Microseira sp. BLCC-F43]|uniref:glycosyltransferase family 39 protein n=1 Tax=Microseira sp. BLCC-F43 TaxID=3153602 RepID=UPI0035B97D02